jgi:hypothetical protein
MSAFGQKVAGDTAENSWVMNLTSSIVARSIACTLGAAICTMLPASPAHAQEPGQIVIVKTDQFADPVAGAVFEALASDLDDSFEPNDPDGDPGVAECTTDADGECVLGPLTAGEYYVRELSAPPGYERDDAFRLVDVTEGASVVIDRATDLDGDGLSDGFLNVRDVPDGNDPYDTYDDDPGDPAFDFETPFDDADADPAPVDEPVAATAGDTERAGPSDGLLTVAGETASQPAVPDATLPAALEELPRTGVGAGLATVFGAGLIVLGGVFALAGASAGARAVRRREPGYSAGRAGQPPAHSCWITHSTPWTKRQPR